MRWFLLPLSLIIASCLLAPAAAEPLEKSTDAYSLRQLEDGSCTFWSSAEVPVWSQSYPAQWEDALISADGRWVVGILRSRLTLVGAKGEVLAENKLPRPVVSNRAWLIGPTAYFMDENWDVQQLSLDSGRARPVASSELVPLLSDPQMPGEDALLLATIHGIRLNPPKLASLQYWRNEIAFYQARLGLPGPAPKPEKISPAELAALLPAAKIQPLLQVPDSDMGLLARLCRPRQLAEARQLAARAGACQAAANRLISQTGDRTAQEWVLQHCLRVPKGESRAEDIAALISARSPLCIRLAPLLSGDLDILERELLINYFLDNPGAEVFPHLAKFVGASDYGSACQKVLREATRVDLGADPQAWAKWFSQQHSSDPRQRAHSLGREPSVPLWRGRSGTVQEVGESLLQSPRTMAVLEAGSTRQVGFTPQGWLARLQGNTAQRAFAWDPQGAVRSEFASEIPVGLEFQFTPDLSVCVLHHPQQKRLAVLGKGPLRWQDIEQTQVVLSPRGDCMVLFSPGFAGDSRLVPIQNQQVLWGKSIPLRGDDRPLFRPTGPSDVLGGERLLQAPWSQPAVPLEDILGYTPDGQKYLTYQQGYGLLDIASKRFEPIAPLHETDTTIKLHRFSPSAAYLALQTLSEVQVADKSHDRIHVIQDFLIHQIAFSPDERFLALAGENSLRLYSLPDMKQVADFRSQVAWGDLVFSPNSAYLAANAGSRLQLWQLHPALEIPVGADPTLLSELWTGQRLAGGAALPLTPAQFRDRLRTWTEQTDQLWDEGKLARQPSWQPFALVALLAAATLIWKKRR